MDKKYFLYTFFSIFVACSAHAITKIPLPVLFGNPEKIAPQISPEGERLAYLAPYNDTLNVWVKTVGQEDDRVITSVSNRGVGGFFWSFDCKTIFYLYDKDGSENNQLYKVNLETDATTCLTPEKVRAGILRYVKQMPNKMLISMNKENPAYFDAYELDVETGNCKLTFKNPGNVAGLIADHNLVIRAISIPTVDGGMQILTRNNTEDSWQPLITWSGEDAANSGVLGFNNDDTKLYILDSHGINTNQFANIDLTTNSQTTLFYDAHCPYDIVNVLFTPDMESPIAAVILGEKKQLVTLDPRYEEDFKLLQETGYGELVSLSSDIKYTKWIVGFAADTKPIRYYYYDRSTKNLSFLFSAKPQLDQYELQPMHPVSFTASDGLTIHGYLTNAAEKSQDQPLVLLVHGGPWARDTWGYSSEVQFLANRGYAVLQVNYRASNGYGKEFLNAGNKEWGRRIHQDLIDAIRWTVGQHIANPKQITIMGASYGGYSALCGAAFNSDIFCCAIDLFGFANILTTFKNRPAYWVHGDHVWKKRVGDPETEADMLKARSPLFYAHQISCPLLLVQGTNDIRCTKEESEQITHALDENKIPYTYIEYDNEGHGIANAEKRLNLYTTIEQFLAQHMPIA